MEKVFGTEERHDILINHGTKKCVLIYGYGEENGQGYDYRQTFDHIPTKEEVVEILHAQIDADTDNTILDSFVWNEKPVWLSMENEFNFKAAYDIAVQSQGQSLPVKFKLGQINGQPVYHTFEDMTEFTDFYTKAMNFINTTLNIGWEKKDEATQWVETLNLKTAEE